MYCYVLHSAGANVMLEYSFDEAHALLEKNAANAREQLSTLKEDHTFLKEQITITEVLFFHRLASYTRISSHSENQQCFTS